MGVEEQRVVSTHRGNILLLDFHFNIYERFLFSLHRTHYQRLLWKWHNFLQIFSFSNYKDVKYIKLCYYLPNLYYTLASSMCKHAHQCTSLQRLRDSQTNEFKILASAYSFLIVQTWSLYQMLRNSKGFFTATYSSFFTNINQTNRTTHRCYQVIMLVLMHTLCESIPSHLVFIMKHCYWGNHQHLSYKLVIFTDK